MKSFQTSWDSYNETLAAQSTEDVVVEVQDCALSGRVVFLSKRKFTGKKPLSFRLLVHGLAFRLCD